MAALDDILGGPAAQPRQKPNTQTSTPTSAPQSQQEQAPGVDGNVAAGYFDKRLVNTDNTLKLNVTRNVPVVTSNNQTFYGSPAGHYLLVMYNMSTRSIPAQTTPEKIVVMCMWS